ncbi:hypothetical protein FPOAC1_002867 [Fusarium poae]|uniref:hypothetical protein n=1 Tax=Fusarium poae TaxID=36050 RepID=UPI001CE9B55E|nr:hypothetical protein FPOAC1_002867 [Fusarium poae]KAG8676858.1 hypothetical protein FPOAC1_002867 [Fusarium poae]
MPTNGSKRNKGFSQLIQPNDNEARSKPASGPVIRGLSWMRRDRAGSHITKSTPLNMRDTDSSVRNL